MGLGIAAVQNILDLRHHGSLKNTTSVIEMGSQELHLKSADFEEMLNIACVTDYDKTRFSLLNNWPGQPRCSTKPLYELLGIKEYCSLDINGEHGSIVHDYNLPLEDTSLYNKFDLVTDLGACEHAFNIAEAYRTMHRLCKPGGLMIIAQALWRGNGYFLYDKKFFEGIAAANNYSIIFNSYIISPGTKTENGTDYQFHIPMNRELLSTIDKSKVNNISVYAVLQKHTNAEFEIPYQDYYMSEKQRHFGFNRLYSKDPPRYSYIPTFNLQKISHHVLLREISRRIRDRLFK